MRPQHYWERINAVGPSVERVLLWTALILLLMTALLALVKLEWTILPQEARAEVVCSEELETSAALVVPFAVPTATLTEEIKGWTQDCQGLTPSMGRSKPADAEPAP